MNYIQQILRVGALVGMINLSAQQVPSDHELYVENIINKLTEKFVQQGRLTFQPGPAPERLNGYDKAVVGHIQPVTSAHWSPNGTRLLTASVDGTARIWNPQTGQTLHILMGHTNSLFCACWSPDGSRVVTASVDGTARIWDAQTAACLHILAGSFSGVHAVAWSPDGNKIATVFHHDQVCIWNAQTGQPLMILEGHTDVVLYVEWSPDSSTLLTISRDKTIRTWDLTLGRCRHILGNLTRTITAAHWSPDGTMIATASDGATCIWDAQTGACLHRFDKLRHDFNTVAWSPDSRKIVTAFSGGTARIWNVAPENLLTALMGRLMLTIDRHVDSVSAVAWSPDGIKIAIASFNNAVCVVNALTGDCLKKSFRPATTVQSPAWSPDSRHVLVTASFDPNPFIFRVTDADSVLNNLKLLEDFFLQQDPNSQDFLLLRLLAGLYDQHGAGERISKNQFSGASDLFKTIPQDIKKTARIVFKLSDDFFEKDEITQEELL